MKLVSSRGGPVGGDPREHLRRAVLGGLAPDGGLYLPAELPRLDTAELEALRSVDLFAETAELLGCRLFSPVLDRETVRSAARGAFDFEVPAVPLDDRTWVLEVFRGPTGSFKDVGARFLARLLSHFRGPGAERIVVLVATSGDTGGAVAHAVHGLPGVHAVVLFPEGRISPVQLSHVTTFRAAGAGQAEDAGRVVPVAIRGSFDDCQRMVKEILDEGSPVADTAVTSANSVNLGRLLPQSFFHAHGWAQLPEDGGELLVSVPSANLGNLTSAVIARRMGVPIRRLVGATNANAALFRFLEAGSLPEGESLETLSSAMDVARPSNLERLLALVGDDRVELAREVVATTHDDEATVKAMREIHERYGYVADPHTAVGWLGMRQIEERGGANGRRLLVSTADPAKFPDTVCRATGVRPQPRPEWNPPAGEVHRVPPVEAPPDTAALRELLRGL